MTKSDAFRKPATAKPAAAKPSPSTRSDDAYPKNARTNSPGPVPNRNAPTSSGTEHDYFRSTPTKAATPIPTATNPWHRYTIGLTW